MPSQHRAEASATEAVSPLFRPEILVAQSQSGMGSISLARPASSWIVAVTSLFIAAALILFGIFGSISKKARVAGITVASSGSLSVTAPNSGVLVQSLVSEGQVVHAGQVLFELSSERRDSKGELTALIDQQLTSQQNSLDEERRVRLSQHEEKKRSLEERLQNNAIEANQLAQETELEVGRQALAQQSLQNYQSLFASEYVSAAQLQEKQADLIDIQIKVSNLRRSKTQLDASRLALQSELASLTNSLVDELSQLQRTQASLQQQRVENRSRKSTFITAPEAGTVTTITYQAGQAVSSGQPLATLIPGSRAVCKIAPCPSPADKIEVHLYAPSRTTGFVAKGQQVLIRYSAFPYQKFGLQKGIITDVSITPFAPSELPQNLASTILGDAQQNNPGLSSGEGLYRIKVALAKQSINLYGMSQALKPGMTLDADVILDRRKIWEWIAEPIFSVAHQ